MSPDELSEQQRQLRSARGGKNSPCREQPAGEPGEASAEPSAALVAVEHSWEEGLGLTPERSASQKVLPDGRRKGGQSRSEVPRGKQPPVCAADPGDGGGGRRRGGRGPDGVM